MPLQYLNQSYYKGKKENRGKDHSNVGVEG